MEKTPNPLFLLESSEGLEDPLTHVSTPELGEILKELQDEQDRIQYGEEGDALSITERRARLDDIVDKISIIEDEQNWRTSTGEGAPALRAHRPRNAESLQARLDLLQKLYSLHGERSTVTNQDITTGISAEEIIRQGKEAADKAQAA